MKLNWSPLIAFNQENIDKISNISGVYRLSYKSVDGNYYVFYIGRSDDSINTSLNAHLNNLIDNPCIKAHLNNLPCYFRFVQVENTEERKNIEKTLYSIYNPKCNLNIPEGKIIEIE